MPGVSVVESEPVDGWRAWNLSVAASGPLLWPTGSGVDSWPHLRPTEARCAVPFVMRAGKRRHRAPGVDCRCGIYAGRSLRSFGRERPAWPPPSVIGRASLWGRVIAHEHGWRGQFGYPSRLRLVCVLCAWFEPGPGGVAVVHAFAGRLYTLCERHRAGIEVPDGRRTRATGIDPGALQGRLLDAYAVDLMPSEPLETLYRRPPTVAPAPYVPSIRALPLEQER